jgi:hypothetical protein
MIRQEGSPSLARRFAGPWQISGHCGLRHRNPQFEQFSVNAGCTHKGLAWLMRRIRSRMLAATSGLPGRRRDFLVQCQAKARRCQRRTVSGRTISRHRRQPDQNRYNTTHKSRSQRWRRKRRGAFFWQTASWWRSARISACRSARVRKLEATKAKRAAKRELIVVATMISRMVGTPAFSDRTEFSVCTSHENVVIPSKPPQ